MEHTDVVIIGAGGAGMMAALTLAKAGRSCVVLEKGKHLSVSNAARAGGPSLADTLLQEEENCIVSAEMLFRHMYGFSRGTVDGGLLYRCIRNGRKVETLLRESGIQLRLTEDLYSVGFRARHFFETPAPQRWELLAKKLEEYGGRVVLNACAGELLTENGRICGVLAVDGQSGEQTAYYGKAVIIASGGYLGNEEMLKQHFGDITVGPLGSRLSDGAGIAMALKAGGMEDRSWGICAGEFGGYHSRMKGRFPGNMRWAMTGGLLVDREGRRFMDEQLLADQPLSVGGEATLRAGSYYAVLDEAFYQGIRTARSVYDFYGRPEEWKTGKSALDRGPWPLPEDLERDISEGWAFRCGSLEEAAAHFSLPFLEETVTRYNAMCEAGQDTEFGKNSWLLKPVAKAPFYVFAYEPSAWCTIGGVKTDAFCRVLDRKQKPISGLYAAGVDNGSCYCAPYYDTEGACLGLAFTSGITAAEHILGNWSA